MSEHSPLLWHATKGRRHWQLRSGDRLIGDINACDPERKAANARFIIRAVNNHYELWAALEFVADWFDRNALCASEAGEVRKNVLTVLGRPLTEAPNETTTLKDDGASFIRAVNCHDELVEALEEAVITIRVWHGPAAWDIYNQTSPEMKKINAALSKARGKT